MNAAEHEQALAAGPLDDTDSTLLNAVREVFLAFDPVPPDLVGRLQFGITWHALDLEITTLTEHAVRPLGVR